MSITLTPSAANRVNDQIAGKPEIAGLRVLVRESGCSGYAYHLEYADEVADGEEVFETNGVRVVVHQDHLKFLSGMQLDYVEDGLSSAFHFNNPNVTEQCGCGESFTVN